MKLAKAIEIKTTYVEHLPPGVNEDWITADKLSIEALEMIKEGRTKPGGMFFHDLPGETADDQPLYEGHIFNHLPAQKETPL